MAALTTEIEKLCASPGAPTLLQEWGPVLVHLGISNSLALCARAVRLPNRHGPRQKNHYAHHIAPYT